MGKKKKYDMTPGTGREGLVTPYLYCLHCRKIYEYARGLVDIHGHIHCVNESRCGGAPIADVWEITKEEAQELIREGVASYEETP